MGRGTGPAFITSEVPAPSSLRLAWPGSWEELSQAGSRRWMQWAVPAPPHPIPPHPPTEALRLPSRGCWAGRGVALPHPRHCTCLG